MSHFPEIRGEVSVNSKKFIFLEPSAIFDPLVLPLPYSVRTSETTPCFQKNFSR